MNKKKLYWSFGINIAIVVLTIIGMGLGVIDTANQHVPYESAFKYFTILSNIFLMIACAIMLVYQILFIKKKIKFIPKWTYIVKLCAVVSTTITFLVVIFFLTPIVALQSADSGGVDIAFLYSGANIIFHILSPILGALCFLLFDTCKTIKLPQTLFALIFTGAYEIFYTTDVYLQWLPESWGEHDWYMFTQFGIEFVPVILVLFLGLTFLLSWLFWLGNKKIHILEKTATK